jgi:hypothetical protein
MASVARRNSEPRIKLALVNKPKAVKKIKVQNTVINQIKSSFSWNNKLAIIGGFLLGAIPPIESFTVAHYAVKPGTITELAGQFASYFVLGGLAYSSITVYQWKLEAVRNKWKALGFVLLTEGVMTFIHIPWLCYVALFQLVMINWVANTYNLTVDKG